MATTKYKIGGQRLVELGSSRGTSDTDYLINDISTKEMFIHDEIRNIDYLNANGNKFFKEIFDTFEENEGQALLELKAYSFVQHCQNMNFQKADNDEFDIKFLVRKFNLSEIKIAKKYISQGELSEVIKVLKSTKK